MRKRKAPAAPPCILCKTRLLPADIEGFFLHPDVGDKCGVVVTDRLGMSVDDKYEWADDKVWARAEEAPSPNPIEFGGAMFTVDGIPMGGTDGGSAFLGIDAAAKLLFEAANQPYLGGSSGPRGWSNVSAFQRCPYLWLQQYSGGDRLTGDAPGPEALEIGSMVHIFLAILYSQRIDPLYPLDPEAAHRFLQLAPVTPSFLTKAWELFEGYRLEYGAETWMVPLAVEEQAVDPRTGQSCRWDLVFAVVEPYENLLPGVYVVNHKTASDNGQVTRDQWQNDGQVLGEIDLYERLGFHRRWAKYGKLRGACVNLIIKTKSPQYTRSWIYPAPGILKDHRKGLAVWYAWMDVAAATNTYPRARAACITRYRTKCELFDHCAGADGSDREIEA